jgi:hypothetical protein
MEYMEMTCSGGSERAVMQYIYYSSKQQSRRFASAYIFLKRVHSTTVYNDMSKKKHTSMDGIWPSEEEFSADNYDSSLLCNGFM